MRKIFESKQSKTSLLFLLVFFIVILLLHTILESMVEMGDPMKNNLYYSFKLPKKLIIFVAITLATYIVLELTTDISNRINRTFFGVSKGVTLDGVTIQHHLDYEIRTHIEQIAKEKYSEPINARIDSVWKGIPGLNGIKVNIDKTVEQALSANKFKNIKLQYEQWQPDIQLHDLEPVAVYRGNQNKQAMALMINVAWGTEYIEHILDILEENNVKATFFVAGNWVENNHESLLKIYLAGHEIGSHAYTHRNMSTLNRQELEVELTRTDELIHKVLPNVEVKLFAPPSGDYNQQVVDVAHANNKYTVLWTLDTVDWQKPSPQTIVNRIAPKAENGALVLMHPTESTVEALKIMVPELSKKYKLITASQLLSSDRNDIIDTNSDIGFP